MMPSQPTHRTIARQLAIDAVIDDIGLLENSAIARHLTNTYFHSFNQNQFDQTAELFGKDGALVPPFESPVIGREAILAYLEKEASKITAFPRRRETQTAQTNIWHTAVTGKVNAVVFKVNVAWYFTIRGAENAIGAEIERVSIKLLASPTELLGLQSSSRKTSA